MSEKTSLTSTVRSPEPQDLNATEKHLIVLGICPDCQHSDWHFGPRGGLAVNIQCLICDARFNVCMVNWGLNPQRIKEAA